MSTGCLNLVGNFRWLSSLLLILCMVAPAVTAQEAKQALTNEAVVEMARAHLGAYLIIQEIRTSPTKFSLDYRSVIRLKQEGVPDSVILAMQTKNAEASPQQKPYQEKDDVSTNAGSHVKSESAHDPYAWQVKDVLDPMTDGHHPEAYFSQDPNPESKEELQVKATCDAEGMHWLLGYFSHTTPASGFKQNVPPGGGAGGMVLGGIRGLVAGLMSSVANAERPTGPYVAVQLRIDNAAPVSLISVDNYINIATLNFAPEHPEGTGDPALERL